MLIRNLGFKSILSKQSYSISHVIGKKQYRLIEAPVGRYFYEITQKYPDRMAIHSYQQNVSFTYSQLYHKALQLATGFIKLLHLKPKDRIGIYSYNKWEWYVIQLAASLADLILVNINPAYLSQELAYTIQKVELKVLITSDKFKKSDYIQIIEKIIPEIKQKHVNPWHVHTKRFPSLKTLVKIQSDHKINGFVNLQDLFIDGDSSILPNTSHHHSQANIQFTSGTTGRPKAATLSHSNILNNGYVIGVRCNYTHQDNIAVPVPLYHCFGMIMGNLAALTRGGCVTYVCQGFDAQKTLQAVSKYKCTSIYGVPTMFIQYLRALEGSQQHYDISKLRTGIIAGALCPQILMDKILNKMNVKEVTNCYGMTETSPVSFQTSKNDTMLQKTTTVGTILHGLQAKTIDSQGNTLPIGKPGEIIVNGWGVMLGYWGDEAATKKSIVDGWMKSGDMGVIDEKGYLTIVGRIKDMIIRGGQNVYPKEIEDYIRKMHHVVDVQVVGVADDKFGQEIAAIIKVNDKHPLKKEDVLKFCKGHIAHYKVPKYVKFVHEFAMTVTGKPQKYIMRQQLEKEMKEKGLMEYSIR